MSAGGGLGPKAADPTSGWTGLARFPQTGQQETKALAVVAWMPHTPTLSPHGLGQQGNRSGMSVSNTAEARCWRLRDKPKWDQQHSSRSRMGYSTITATIWVSSATPDSLSFKDQLFNAPIPLSPMGGQLGEEHLGEDQGLFPQARDSHGGK